MSSDGYFTCTSARSIRSRIENQYSGSCAVHSANGEKTIVVGSSTLSADGEAGSFRGQTISVGNKVIILGSKTTEFSAFEPSGSPNSGNLVIGAENFSLAGLHHLLSQGKLQPLYNSEFSSTSLTIDPKIGHIFPTVVNIGPKSYGRVSW